MAHFMVDISLPVHISEDFQSKIPLQIESVALHMQSGNIISYSLAYDRSKLWVVLDASSQNEAKSILKTMPLYHYFDYNITELMFNNINISLYTNFSLN